MTTISAEEPLAFLDALGHDEELFAMPYEMYARMVTRWRETFLTTKTWAMVRKKVGMSRKAWGEGTRSSTEE